MPRLLLTIVIILAFACNNKGISIVDFKNVSGFVIGREICHNNKENDDWLLDLSHMENPPFGDTLTFDGEHFEKVIKLKGLKPPLQKPGLPVSIDYKIITDTPVIPQGCENPLAQTFLLRQITILNQFELR